MLQHRLSLRLERHLHRLPRWHRLMKQKMTASIIFAALSEKLGAEVYLMEHPLAMLRHLHLTYNVKGSASIGAAKSEYMGLYLDGDDSMVEHIKMTRRVLDELQEQHVIVSDEVKRQNFVQSQRLAWNGFVGVIEACVTFEAMLQRYQAEAIRREQQKGRRSTSGVMVGITCRSTYVL
ncbi:hypothetical protein PC128_g21756 [Phytophthora cactorum]|nr:hypothetical protein PC128_g21756 [Phytophthora cactorum]